VAQLVWVSSRWRGGGLGRWVSVGQGVGQRRCARDERGGKKVSVRVHEVAGVLPIRLWKGSLVARLGGKERGRGASRDNGNVKWCPISFQGASAPWSVCCARSSRGEEWMGRSGLLVSNKSWRRTH